MIHLTNANVDSMTNHNPTWASQFKESMNVNGGHLETATARNYVMHFFTFGWKVKPFNQKIPFINRLVINLSFQLGGDIINLLWPLCSTKRSCSHYCRPQVSPADG